MCLIAFAYRQHPAWQLILAANRDEFYARPTASMAYWEDAPEVLAGRDLVGGGTWLGITRSGRFAAVTNYRDPGGLREDAPSRGLLVADFLRGTEKPQAYLEILRTGADRYNGFSLLVGDSHGLYYFSNRENAVRELHPGIYGLSNHLLDTPWPKVLRVKRALRQLIEANAVETQRILEILADPLRPSDEDLPDTGVGLTWERLLSPVFISSEHYGTRSSTALLISHDGRVSLTERERFGGDIKSYQWQLEPSSVTHAVGKLLH
jgi:uncharacterized protein with NRDE domain